MNRVSKSLLLLWVSHFFMDFFTGIWPIYKTIAQIDIAQAGLIAGVSGFLGEILQLFFGYFSDRGHRKRVLLLGLILSSSIIWITFTTHIFSSFFLLLLLMVGSGSFHPAAMGIASNLAGEKKGSTILLFASGGAIGLGVSQLAFTKLRELFAGHAFIVVLPLMAVILWLYFHQFPNQTYSKPAPLRTFFKPIMHCRKQLFLLYLSQVAVQGLMLSFTFLLPDILRMRSCHGWLCMGGGHLCFIAGAALTMLPAGWLCDRYGQKKVLLGVVSLACVFFFFFLTSPPSTLTGMSFLLVSLGSFLGIINPIIVSWGHRLVPESPSTVSALLMGFAWCFSSLGPACAGLLVKYYQNQPYLSALASLGSLLFLIFFFIALMPRPVSKLKATEPEPLPLAQDQDPR
jgi:FSR family fosmidomycin resistance protein-like MFS transporter